MTATRFIITRYPTTATVAMSAKRKAPTPRACIGGAIGEMHRIAEKLRAEYTTQLGNTNRRLDAMLTGHSPTSAEHAVVVELKQWSDGTIGPPTTRRSNVPVTDITVSVIMPTSAGTGG